MYCCFKYDKQILKCTVILTNNSFCRKSDPYEHSIILMLQAEELLSRIISEVSLLNMEGRKPS